MKKILLAIIIFAFVLYVYPINVYATYEKPILFRGIEWYSNAEKVSEFFPGQKWHSSTPNTVSSIENDLLGTTYNETFYHSKIVHIVSTYKPKDINVAGFSVHRMSLSFVVIPDGESLIHDAQHSALFFAKYELLPPVLNDAFDSLKEKLSLLYGEPDIDQEKNGFAYEKQVSWLGANETAVSLVSTEYPSGNYTLFINYGILGSKKLLDSAAAVVSANQLKANESNVNGL